jgi:hypothetical protein
LLVFHLPLSFELALALEYWSCSSWRFFCCCFCNSSCGSSSVGPSWIDSDSVPLDAGSPRGLRSLMLSRSSFAESALRMASSYAM